MNVKSHSRVAQVVLRVSLDIGFIPRHLMVDGGKMSKSLGNFYTIRDLIDRGVSPAAVRLELIKTHYRANSNFTLQGLKDSQRQIERWRKVHAWLSEHADVARSGPGPLVDALPRFEAALYSDLNVAGAIGVLNEAIGELPMQDEPTTGGDGSWSEDLGALDRMDSVLGVLTLESSGGGGAVDEAAILVAIEARNAARDAKDWGEADRIRDELLEAGIAIKDGAEGTTWSQVLQ